MTCCCGHVDDEHDVRPSGPAECLIEGCDCIHYEWDGEDDE